MKEYGLIILAAGGSARLGSPKQLLNYNNQSLLKHTVNIALQLNEVIPLVVIGALKNSMVEELSKTGVSIVINDSWQQGMSSSIQAGLKELLVKAPQINACIFTVCDQPFISTALLQQLIFVHQQTLKGLVAAQYDGINGTPVLVNKKYFNELLKLKNEEGAKKLLQKYLNDLAVVTFKGGEVDIDTQEDYKKLINADR